MQNGHDGELQTVSACNSSYGSIQEETIEYIKPQKSYKQRLFDVIRSTYSLGIASFGGPQAHIANFHRIFVVEKEWVSEDQFTGLFAMSSSLPGSASNHLLVALCTIHAGVVGGFISFLMFSLPAALILAICGVYLQDITNIPPYIVAVQGALQCVAVALIAAAFCKLVSKLIKTKFSQTLLVISACVSLLYKPYWIFPVLMAVGGLLSFVKESIEEFYTTRIEQYHLEHPTNIIEWIHCTKILFRLRKETPLESPSSDFIESGTNEYEHVPRPAIGVVVFIVFILCATAIFVIPNYVQLPDLAALFMLFFRIGCTIFGGGNVLVPILLTEMEGMITDQQFFDGFIIQSSLPGPFYNITSYLGGVVGGWLGAIVCWLTIYVPGFFFMYSILPFWGKIQHKPFVRKILTGVNAAAIGLVVTAVVMLYTKAVRTEIDAMFVVIAFGMVMIHNTPAPLVVLIVGLSAFFSFFIKMY